MSNEFLNADNEPKDEKELLRQRREEQVERVKQQYQTDAKEKEEAKLRYQQEEELQKELKPFYSVRKVCVGICALMWVFAAFCLLTGTLEMRMFLPLCLFALCALAGINAPIFFKKKKKADAVVAIICAVICFAVGAVIFTLG